MVDKAKIIELAQKMRECLLEKRKNLKDSVNLLEYKGLVKENEIWTAALQKAVNEHEIIYIPAGEYWIDDTIILPSNRMILADENAVIKKVKGMNVLMLRNSMTKDGGTNHDIFISGGCWAESEARNSTRCGLYDKQGNFEGVSAGMFFQHVENLYIENVKISQIGGFGIQVSHLTNGCFKNLLFDQTEADGLHINGFSENIFAENIRGMVGDDLVALNAYDWPQSSVAFGPIKNVFCDKLEVFPESRYKAFRILPGKYFFKDGSVSECSIHNVVIRNVKGIDTYKFYFQTPRYQLGEAPAAGEPGCCGNLYFENIEIASVEPVDKLPEYLESDPVKGSIAGFELGANIEQISFENVSVQLDREKYPMSFFLCIGPKSVRMENAEIFDPYISSTAQRVILKNIFVNGQKVTKETLKEVVHEIVFDDIYQEGAEKTFGKIEEILLR